MRNVSPFVEQHGWGTSRRAVTGGNGGESADIVLKILHNSSAMY